MNAVLRFTPPPSSSTAFKNRMRKTTRSLENNLKNDHSGGNPLKTNALDKKCSVKYLRVEKVKKHEWKKPHMNMNG